MWASCYIEQIQMNAGGHRHQLVETSSLQHSLALANTKRNSLYTPKLSLSLLPLGLLLLASAPLVWESFCPVLHGYSGCGGDTLLTAPEEENN